MARAGPRKIRAYSLEFKLTAVRLSRQPGIQVQAVAAALDIHPFMLSKWRKQVRDGCCAGRGGICGCRRRGRSGGCRSWSGRTPCFRRSMRS